MDRKKGKKREKKGRRRERKEKKGEETFICILEFLIIYF